MVLLTIRQYEGKSYRMFVEWLIEAYYLRLFLQLPCIPHFTTLQKFADRINNTLLGKVISSFIIVTGITNICRYGFNWIQGDTCMHQNTTILKEKRRRRK